MSFIKYSPEDSVASSEIVTRGAWSNDNNTLTTFFTSSVQSSTTLPFYLDVYNTVTTTSLQFDIQYGHISGSGSGYFNSAVPGKTAALDVYGQYRNLIYGTEDQNFSFNSTSSADIFAINVSRAKYKESIKPGSFNLTLSGSSGYLYLSDNSNDISTTSFLGSNRYYNVVSGSNGYGVTNSRTYGYLFPDIGVIILAPNEVSGSNGRYISGSINRGANLEAYNHKTLYEGIKGGANFQLQSQETVSSRYFDTHIKFGELNYTTNPSIIDDNGNLLYSTLINSPQAYATTVGLYNDNNELLAVAKLSKPLVKDFTKTLTLRIKLSFALIPMFLCLTSLF